MEHIITITSSGTRSAYRETQFTEACNYMLSLANQGISFSYTLE